MATAREIRATELEALRTLYRQLHPDDPPLESIQLRDRFERLLADPSIVIVVVEHEAQLVGTCQLSIVPNLARDGRPFGVIENVITHEAYRNQGFGRLCLSHAIAIAEERYCYKIQLQTGTDQEWKRQFYESCGFDRHEKTGFVKRLD
ncbi:GNAT family N-acetyltransferase [Halocatena halophila]|uniref:GNAT family N-acetyltransferase n=1 Tax=Halocatena halophila TaxID=2814576 RepID=UPI002ED570B9